MTLYQLRSASAALAISVGALAPLAHSQDIIVPAGVQVVLQTDGLPLPIVIDSLQLKAGSTLRLVGTQPVLLVARQRVELNGTLDLSGTDAPDVVQLATPTIPKLPGSGEVSGAGGGAGSPLSVQSSPAGADGVSSALSPVLGAGLGGESSFGSLPAEKQRPGGGAGGRLGADEAIVGSPEDPDNVGLVALPGEQGLPNSTGALSGVGPAMGGALGASLFTDGSSDNDFWGSATVAGVTVQGELLAPVSGSGGGGGGDVMKSAAFPIVPWNKQAWKNTWSAGGGGGGAGLGLIFTPSLVIGPQGRILAEGGDGGAGESIAGGINNTAGGGGGGSGGMLVVQALDVDLTAANAEALSARGGAGGESGTFGQQLYNGGGAGGPGLIQLHVPDPANVRLPAGASLGVLSSPTAKVLNPLF